MMIKDAFRAQYFLAALEREVEETNEKFCHIKCFFRPFRTILDDFASELLNELDQFLLPTLVLEIDKAKQAGDLIGNTPTERYQSFFVRGKSYTSQARSILDKYPFLFELVDGLISQTFEAFSLSMQRFLNDQTELKTWL